MTYEDYLRAMRSEYDYYIVIVHDDFEERGEFETFKEALEYVNDNWSADDVVDQIVQIDGYYEDDEYRETFNELEVYDYLNFMNA